MVDVSRRGFLTLLGLSVATAATSKLTRALETVAPLPSVASAPLVQPKLPPLVSNCFLNWRGSSFPLGILQDAYVYQRYGNLPGKSGANRSGKFSSPVRLNAHSNTTVRLITDTDTSVDHSYHMLRSLGDVGLSVEAEFEGELLTLSTQHATPISAAISDGVNGKRKLEFELVLIELRLNHQPLPDIC